MTVKEHLKNYRKHLDLAKHYAWQVQDRPNPPQDLFDLWEDVTRKMETVERAVKALPDPAEQLLIRLRYFEGYSWTKVGFTMHYSKSSLQRIHAQALKHLKEGGMLTEEEKTR